MFQRISLRTSEGEELFWGFSVLRSDVPPPIDLPTAGKTPENDNGGEAPQCEGGEPRKDSQMCLKAPPVPRSL